MTDSKPKTTMRIVVVTGLYPNCQYPRHGIFVEQRLRHLVASGRVEARVVAPVPWFWSTHPRYGRYARMAAVPEVEYRHSIEIRHPRYLVIPKIGMSLGPASMARAVRPVLESLRGEGFDFDLIDAHYFYPDGVAAARLAHDFHRPVVITARGADLNSIPEKWIPRRQIRQAARTADGLITVSRSLANRLATLGIDGDRVETLRNGVDLTQFGPGEPDGIREQLGLSNRVWLCVGHMIERKGMHLVLDALAQTPGVSLILAGDGPDEAALRSQAHRLGVAERVHFVGAIAHHELPRYYNAADALVLPSRSEGMPNVVLEALACGTAVIATAVDGIPEIITAPIAGRLMCDRSAKAVVDAWNALDEPDLSQPRREERRRFAEDFGWEATAHGQLALFGHILKGGSAGGSPVAVE